MVLSGEGISFKCTVMRVHYLVHNSEAGVELAKLEVLKPVTGKCLAGIGSRVLYVLDTKIF